MLLNKVKYVLLAIPLAVAMTFAGSTVAGKVVKAARPEAVVVPQGTPLVVKLDQSVSTKYSRSGETFEATVISPVVVDNQVVVPSGTPVEGRVVYAHPSGRLRGRANLELTLDAMRLDQDTYELRTNTVGRVSGSHKVRNIAWIGGGGGAGALIGALAAGGKGALIGGPVGAGAGLGIAALTGRKHASVPAESAVTFRLREPLSLPPNSGRPSNRS
ncbi:MAG TPA: hypothetical protein VE825_17610 [Terriglobales bacterium]|jgi:outer membrane lipoprotein SlyB|nr:hypothetical protein [Terriglobales bacterium]